MRNQTSFRLTTTLLPTDTTAKTTTVINKLDSNGEKFYPSFTEETVVLTNDDRTIMETTRAICTDWVLTFIKRWLSDDASETQVANRKLTWNPWSLCFITAGAGDWIDKDDNITWTGNQTYTGNLVSQWNATYNWLLTTNKWVKYPSFANVEALNAYANPFGWMFATVDSTWELYRYNAVTQERALVESSQPANPEMASTTTIWTVRGATATEFANWTATGSQWELLVATPAQIQSIAPVMNLQTSQIWETIELDPNNPSQDKTYQFTATRSWWIYVEFNEIIVNWNRRNRLYVSSTWTLLDGENPSRWRWNDDTTWFQPTSLTANITIATYIPVWPWTITFLLTYPSSWSSHSSEPIPYCEIKEFFYFW